MILYVYYKKEQVYKNISYFISHGPFESWTIGTKETHWNLSNIPRLTPANEKGSLTFCTWVIQQSKRTKHVVYCSLWQEEVHDTVGKRNTEIPGLADAYCMWYPKNFIKFQTQTELQKITDPSDCMKLPWFHCGFGRLCLSRGQGHAVWRLWCSSMSFQGL